ncbi:MAG: hypothetical protein QOF58_8183 [Pseudonocardiales bacterium]|jgi:hypothetical protein|nr:hypothetical protein [Pseudonocardiales bacterium]
MALPGNVSLVTVTGAFIYPDDTYPTGTVEFRISGDPWIKDAGADTTILPKSVVCTINGTGQIVGPAGAVGGGGVGVKLPATDDVDLAPNGFVYDVILKFGGLPEKSYSISLPASPSTVDLADLAPVTPVEGGGVQLVLQVDGVSPDGTGNVTLNARRVKAPATLADAATIATDASIADLFRVTLQGNRTLGNPTNPTDGQLVRWEIKQDPTGSRTLALDTKFVFGTDLTSITLSNGAGVTDILGATYNAAQDEWRVLGFTKGF